MKRIGMMMMAAALLFSACQSKHEQLQQQIKQRKEALQHHQDSALKASQREVERLDQELQWVNADYARKKKAAEAAHAAGTATAQQLNEVTMLRMHRDSLQTQFDVLCAKIKYIRKRQKE